MVTEAVIRLVKTTKTVRTKQKFAQFVSPRLHNLLVRSLDHYKKDYESRIELKLLGISIDIDEWLPRDSQGDHACMHDWRPQHVHLEFYVDLGLHWFSTILLSTTLNAQTCRLYGIDVQLVKTVKCFKVLPDAAKHACGYLMSALTCSMSQNISGEMRMSCP
jgi:hypothetical protein